LVVGKKVMMEMRRSKGLYSVKPHSLFYTDKVYYSDDITFRGSNLSKLCLDKLGSQIKTGDFLWGERYNRDYLRKWARENDIKLPVIEIEKTLKFLAINKKVKK
jgi:hypothetical protein